MADQETYALPYSGEQIEEALRRALAIKTGKSTFTATSDHSTHIIRLEGVTEAAIVLVAVYPTSPGTYVQYTTDGEGNPFAMITITGGTVQGTSYTVHYLAL